MTRQSEYNKRRLDELRGRIVELERRLAYILSENNDLRVENRILRDRLDRRS